MKGKLELILFSYYVKVSAFLPLGGARLNRLGNQLIFCDQLPPLLAKRCQLWRRIFLRHLSPAVDRLAFLF